MSCKINRLVVCKKIILLISSLLPVKSTCNPTDNEIKEFSIRLDNMQIVMEKQELKIENYEEKNGLLEVRNTANEMRTDRLEELLGKLKEKTDRIDIMQTNMDLLATKNSEYEAKIGLIESLAKQLDRFEKKNAENEAQMDSLKIQVSKCNGKMVLSDGIKEDLNHLSTKNTQNDAKIVRLEERNARNEENNSKNDKRIGLLEAKNQKNDAKIIQLDNLKVKVENLLTEIGSVVESNELTNSRIEENFKIQETAISQLEKDLIKLGDDIISIKTKHDAVTALTKNIQDELTDRQDNTKIKLEKLTTKIDASTEFQEWSTSILEKKWAKPEEEIIKINANCIRRISGDSQTNTNVPSSCKELAIKGHPFNGLYLVKNSDTKNIEAVLCNFENTDVSQVFIGNVDVKTKSIHFYVQRTSNFGFFGSVIPFEVARLNEAGAFNLALGIFTAPVAGIYSFQLTAVKNPTVAILWIYLQLNGVNVGIAGTSQGFTGSFSTVSLSSSLRLKAGDRVNLFHSGGILFDNTEHYTHFSGSLVKEDMA